MKTVAIITARGGSKRIPRKNIKPFLGKPIIEYSIEAALKSGLFEEVMVSTDDAEIAAIAKKAGATVPFMRSDNNANDFANTTDVLQEVLQQYQLQGKFFDVLCCIYPTAPFVTAGKLKAAFALLENENVYNVVPMVAYSFPPQRALLLKNDFLEPVDEHAMQSRSQDLVSWYHDCGQFYFAKIDAFAKNSNLLYHNTKPYFVSELEVQDIDNETDWKMAELKYRFMQENNAHLEKYEGE